MIIVFSGWNQRAVIAFLRTLEKNHIDNYVIIASSANDTILRTSYAKKVMYIREHKELIYEEIISYIRNINVEQSKLVLPSTEALNRFLLEHRLDFESEGCIIPLVEERMYRQLSDKSSFYYLCKREGITVPKIFNCKETNEIPIPVVAKPKQYMSMDGKCFSPIIIKSETEKRKFGELYDIKDFDIEDYIDGRSLYLFYYFSQNGIVTRFSQENLCQQAGGKSILLAIPSKVHLESIADDYEELLSKVGYKGAIMIEIRLKDGDYYMIEANPRFWGPSQLCVDSNINFFEFFLAEHNYEISPKEMINSDARYFWEEGFVQNPENDEECVWYGDAKQFFFSHRKEFEAYSLYNRKDTKFID